VSGIAALYNVPGTPEELSRWSFSHAVHHRDINDTIFKLSGFQIFEFLMDPISVDNIDNWLQSHQLMHQQMDEILGIVGYDLYDVDWQDQSQLAGWIFLNANEHFNASEILQIG
jgi:hypothetical protein